MMLPGPFRTDARETPPARAAAATSQGSDDRPAEAAFLNDLARARLAAGVDLWLQRVDLNTVADAQAPWFVLRLDADVMGRLLRCRASCREDTLIEDVIFPPDYWRAGGATKSLRVRHHAWTCAEHRSTGSLVSGEIHFDHLLAALGAPQASIGALCGASCFWYGGVLVGVADGTAAALRSLQADHPELVARQIQLEMAAVLRAAESSAAPAAPRRARAV